VSEALLGGSPPRRGGQRAAAAASLVAVALAGALLVAAGWHSRPASLLGRVFGRGPFQQLAYDGPTDTPPVTWYFPATDTQNTLGYTWNEAQYQDVGGTYMPGVMTDNGLAQSTADTIGFNTGPTTTAQPFGAGGPYSYGGGESAGQIYYQSEDSWASAKKGRATALKQRGAQTTMLAAESDIDEMEGALAQSASSNARKKAARDDPLEDRLNQKLAQIHGKGSGAAAQSTYQALLNDLNLSDELAGASLGGKKGAAAHAQAVIQAGQAKQAQKQSLKSLKSMHFNIDSVSPPARYSPYAQPSYAVAPQKPVQALGSVDPFEYAEGADTSSPFQTQSDNVVGAFPVNSALSSATSNSFGMQKDVIMQAPATILPPAVSYTPAQPQFVNAGQIYHHGENWAYTGENGAENWGDKNAAWRVCKTGKNQSPINLELNLKRDDNLKPLRWIGSTNPYEASLISPLYKNALTVEGLHGKMTVSGEDMHLKSAVIHTPSEHRFQGRQMHGEIQFEHTAEVDGQDVTMIVSAFLVVSDHTAPSLRTLFDAVSGYEGVYRADNLGTMGYYPPQYAQDVKPDFWVNTAKLAEDVLGTGSNYANYLTYYGSLTKPPCTEGVTWVLLKTPIPIAASDHAILLEEQGALNYRPTQELYDREVYDTATGRSGGFQSPGFF